jgi:hypothetical protein
MGAPREPRLERPRPRPAGAEQGRTYCTEGESAPAFARLDGAAKLDSTALVVPPRRRGGAGLQAMRNGEDPS